MPVECAPCPVAPQPPACPQPAPPAGANCCLRVRYTFNGVAWVIDPINTQCVDNDQCAEYVTTCTPTEFTFEARDRCVCYALPPNLPQQTCDPSLCNLGAAVIIGGNFYNVGP